MVIMLEFLVKRCSCIVSERNFEVLLKNVRK